MLGGLHVALVVCLVTCWVFCPHSLLGHTLGGLPSQSACPHAGWSAHCPHSLLGHMLCGLHIALTVCLATCWLVYTLPSQSAWPRAWLFALIVCWFQWWWCDVFWLKYAMCVTITEKSAPTTNHTLMFSIKAGCVWLITVLWIMYLRYASYPLLVCTINQPLQTCLSLDVSLVHPFISTACLISI